MLNMKENGRGFSIPKNLHNTFFPFKKLAEAEYAARNGGVIKIKVAAWTVNAIPHDGLRFEELEAMQVQHKNDPENFRKLNEKINNRVQNGFERR